MRSPLVSFVIPVFNGSVTLNDCLTAILNQSSSIPFEVIVVNNNSRDDSVQIALRHPVRVVDEPTQGRSQARNHGLREATGEWIAFVDCDVILDPNWLDELHRTVVLNDHTGGQGRIFPATKKRSFFSDYREYLIRSQTQGRFCHLDAEHFFYPMINSAACLYRKIDLLAVDGFDVELESHEDIDLTWRLWMRGATFAVAFSAHARVYWPHGGYINYLIRSWRMGRSLGHLYRLWDITILQSVKIPALDQKTVFHLMMACQNFVFSTAFTRSQIHLLKAQRSRGRLLARTGDIRFQIGNSEVIVVNAGVRLIWTSRSLILKDCSTLVKFSVPRDDRGVGANDFRRLVKAHRLELEASGLIRVFRSSAAD